MSDSSTVAAIPVACDVIHGKRHSCECAVARACCSEYGHVLINIKIHRNRSGGTGELKIILHPRQSVLKIVEQGAGRISLSAGAGRQEQLCLGGPVIPAAPPLMVTLVRFD